jgi:hypothetical protein
LHRVPFPLADCEGDITIGRVALPRLVSTWLPVFAWAGVIFAVSSIPSLSTELGVWDLVLRKLAHFTEYAVLGFLLARAAPPLAAFALGALYAVSDEVHQSFVSGRQGVPEDVAIDVVGIVAGILVFRRAAR